MVSVNQDDSALQISFAALLTQAGAPDPDPLSRALIAELRRHRQPVRRSWAHGPVPGDVMVVSDIAGRCWERESGDPDRPAHDLWSYYRNSQHSRPDVEHRSHVPTDQLMADHGPLTEITARNLLARQNLSREIPPGQTLGRGLGYI